MQSSRKPNPAERVFRLLHHPYYMLGAAAMFFAVALLFSWTLGAHGVRGEEYKRHWGLMVSHVLYGLITFGVGIRGLCLRRAESDVRVQDASGTLLAGSEEDHSPAPVRMSSRKFLSLAALASWAWAGINWRAGHHTTALYALGLTPLFFAFWGLSYVLWYLFASPEKREIARNMSSADRARVEEMAREYGKLVGMYFALPLSAIATLTYLLTDQDARIAGAVFAGGLLIGMPVAYRLAAPVRNFKPESKSVEAELQPPS